ncbi:hypothetical protein B0T20DRAFT_348875 [Sordaria brevicollis]|uniref:Uncharacterized protein n=1 Tax=Sordaria brevicollis TaxID=83679 RepID=A0AAE0UEH3_SORBR|nr:hypothetical protein B0T20DRAFT_348875 [Sordaria brevicollis]
MSHEVFGHSFTNSSDPNWVPEPSTRGTFGILSVCLVTLGLCVWTAIHLNVPEHDEPGWKQLLRKIGWLMLGLLSPEIVSSSQIVYTAYQQYVQARSLVKTMNKQGSEHGSDGDSTLGLDLLFGRDSVCERNSVIPSRRSQGDEENPPTVAVKPGGKWTMAHGFLAVMGGIAIEMRDNDPHGNAHKINNFFPTTEFTDIKWERKWYRTNKRQRQRTRLTLTPKGLQFLKDDGYEKFIPDLSKTKIKDKSKGSAFAKTLVCIQASWFCVQCLTRFSQGLAISLLELNTFGHAICTLFIYALWWNKPLDVVEHETILFQPSTNDRDLEEAKIIAALCTKSKAGRDTWRSSQGRRGHDYSCTSFSQYILWFSAACVSFIPPLYSVFVKERLATIHQLYNQPITVLLSRSLIKVMLYSPRLCLSVTESAAPLDVFLSSSPKKHTAVLGGGECDGIILLDPDKRSEYTPMNPSTAIEMPCMIIQHSDLTRWRLALGSDQDQYHDLPKDAFADRAHNLPRFQDYDQYLPLFIGFGAVGLIYGGLHCVAWNAPFTSSVERVLWRVSSITIAATGVLVACVFSWTTLPPVWQEPRLVYEIYDEFTDRPWADTPIAEWCTGVKLATSVEYFIMNQPFYNYENNRPLRMFGLVAIWLSRIPAILFLSSTLFFLYLFKIIFDVFTALLTVLYVLARIYLVVISFINLAHLPDSAYQLPQWSRYVPHIG